MIKQGDIKVGDKVCFQPPYYKEDQWENGVVKEIPDEYTSYVRVVFKCGKDWKNYQNYTSVLTHCRDLQLGWKEKEKSIKI